MIYNYYTRNNPNNNLFQRFSPLNNQYIINNQPIANPTTNNEIKDNTNAIENFKTIEEESGFRIGPATIHSDRIVILGFNLYIDDIIIICIAIFLFFENKRDYLLIIALIIIFFDISIDSIKDLSLIKNLFNAC